jgi:hypothetical protein
MPTDPFITLLETEYHLTPGQIAGLRCEQRALARRGRHDGLASLALQFRYLTKAQFQQLVRLERALNGGPTGPNMIGHFLLAAGLITPIQLADALREQARTGQRLGEILVARRQLTPLQLHMSLAMQRADQGARAS